MEDNEEKIKFLLTLDDPDRDKIMEYNELLDIINRQVQDELENPDIIWTFKSIEAHWGPLKPGDKDYKGSLYNVLVNWEDGSSTYEPLNIIAADDPVTCAKYAKENDLLDTKVWEKIHKNDQTGPITFRSKK